MPLKQENHPQNTTSFTFAVNAISYRMPMPVIQVLQLKGGDQYPICPRCNSSFEREYSNYCDRCGQRLVWNLFEFAHVKKAGKK